MQHQKVVQDFIKRENIEPFELSSQISHLIQHKKGQEFLRVFEDKSIEDLEKCHEVLQDIMVQPMTEEEQIAANQGVSATLGETVASATGDVPQPLAQPTVAKKTKKKAKKKTQRKRKPQRKKVTR